MNVHDSEKIAGMFELDGMIKANSEENADVLFINTCTIRENADDKTAVCSVYFRSALYYRKL